MASTVILIDNTIHFTDEESITIRSLDDLAQLHREIGAYLLAHRRPQSKDRYISSIEARKIATHRGLTIPRTTLVNAYSRGNIQGARKNGGRWESPESSFLAWLDRWQARRDGGDDSSS